MIEWFVGGLIGGLISGVICYHYGRYAMRQDAEIYNIWDRHVRIETLEEKLHDARQLIKSYQSELIHMSNWMREENNDTNNT